MYNEYAMACRILHSANIILAVDGVCYAYNEPARTMAKRFNLMLQRTDDGMVYVTLNMKSAEAIAKSFDMYLVEMKEAPARWRTALDNWRNRLKKEQAADKNKLFY